MSILKKYRKQAGMTRRELSEKSKITERTIRAYEDNSRSLKRASLCGVCALADALSIDRGDFICEVLNDNE